MQYLHSISHHRNFAWRSRRQARRAPQRRHFLPKTHPSTHHQTPTHRIKCGNPRLRSNSVQAKQAYLDTRCTNSYPAHGNLQIRGRTTRKGHRSMVENFRQKKHKAHDWIRLRHRHRSRKTPICELARYTQLRIHLARGTLRRLNKYFYTTNHGLTRHGMASIQRPKRRATKIHRHLLLLRTNRVLEPHNTILRVFDGRIET